MTISQRIFSILESKHLSQKDLAKYAGLSPAAISGWKSKTLRLLPTNWLK